MKSILRGLLGALFILMPGLVWAQPFYTVHVTSVQMPADAERIVSGFHQQGLEAFSRYEAVPGKGNWHQVYVGRFTRERDAKDAIAALKQRGLLAKDIRYVIVQMNFDGATTPPPSAAAEPGLIYTVHLSSFRKAQDAEVEAGNFSDRGLDAFIRQETVLGQGKWYRVYVGRFNMAQQASALADLLIRQGILSKYSNYNIMKIYDTGTEVAVPDEVVSVDTAAQNVSAFRETIEGSYVASYRDKGVAEKQAEGLTLRGWPAFVTEGDIKGVRWYRVYLSPTGERGGGLKGFDILTDLAGTRGTGAEAPCCRDMNQFTAMIALLDSIADAVPDMGLLSALRITGVDETVNPLPLGVSRFSRNLYKSAIATLAPGSGMTSLAGGVAASDNELTLMNGRKALIVLSDFKTTRNVSDPLVRVQSLAEKYGQDLCVYPIYFCTDEAGVKLAKDMATTAACGNFYDGCLLLEDRTYFDAMIRQIFLR